MEPYSGDTKVIAKVGTTPEDRGLETEDFKAKFDEGLTAFVEWFNTTHKAEFAKQLDINGYQKLPGGLILQWGRITIPANAGYVDVTLPIAFPSIIRNVQATVDYVSGGEGGAGTSQLNKMVTPHYSGNTTITLYVKNPDQTNPNIDIRVDWQALGY